MAKHKSNGQKEQIYLIRPQELKQFDVNKLQSIDIHVKEFNSVEDFIKNPLKRSNYKCYIIGNYDYCEGIAEEISKRSLGFRTLKRIDKTEKDIMNELKRDFLEKVEEQSNINKQPKESVLQKKIKSLQDSGLSDEDLVSLMMALDEMKHYKIFPETPEVVYKVLLKLTKEYIDDEQIAKKAVYYFIHNPEKFLEK